MSYNCDVLFIVIHIDVCDLFYFTIPCPICLPGKALLHCIFHDEIYLSLYQIKRNAIIVFVKKHTILLHIIILVFFISGCGKEFSPYSESGFYFDTYVGFTLYGEDKKYLKDCLDICEKDELLFSAHDEDSLLYTLNNGISNDNPELVPVLKEALDYCDMTDGAADPSIGAVSLLWDFSDPDHPVMPSDSDISAALKHVGASKISISGNDILITDPDAKIDLGFIAKGYVSAEIKQHLIDIGVKSGIINLGGNIVVIGTRPDGRAYNVGIHNPFGPSPLLTFNITDSAIVTSGTYERYFIYDDKLYHHILDPHTGYPADNGTVSVTIVSSDPVKADALSTACLVMGIEKGLEFIENTDDAEALFIDSNSDIYTSSGFPDYELNE
ncbi:MAG: FAD:protein FMN transferase [Lachnospiraceae bacterium]|nr:FAD:protein FMN transferase [Lachnospiraceae bacterium]